MSENIPKLCVAYYRLSKESRSGGLGLDAQRQSVATYLKSIGGELIGEFTEIESGKRTDRAELQAALELCRKKRARLCIAKLDRLARNAAFLLTLRDSGVDFVAADMPHADRLTVGILAVFAEHERELIGRRTREALKAAKARGVRLGSPNMQAACQASCRVRQGNATRYLQNIAPVLRELQGAGVATLREMAAALNARGFRTARGNRFSPQITGYLLGRLTAPKP